MLVAQRAIVGTDVCVHRHWHPEVRGGEGGAGEPFFGNADDGVAPVVEPQRLPDNRWVAGKTPDPPKAWLKTATGCVSGIGNLPWDKEASTAGRAPTTQK